MDQLDDLDFTDDLALLSHSQAQMQKKTSALEEAAATLGMKINRDKTKMMRMNHQNTQLINLQTGSIAYVDSFTYLGSLVNTAGGT